MKFKNQDNLLTDAKELGMADISKMSAINHLAATKLGIDSLIMLDQYIKGIECNLWSIVPLALSKNETLFNEQVNNVKEAIERFLTAALLMSEMK